ncbi:glucose 1-dehydrogenase [Methylopila capsulata]|uniref:Glucose 1-dehydrogenase n=1 Tax=Methylopila capsulata TaxID=61654 RepID=A0A9W6ITV5_9HYPH|nr:glucose 1-dehydrogenase [Methylopila capsulata]MBM7849806.1 glucose 1-dehydrogenase [Methylopila capsulata]GLK55095.1 glucose-1-dehydrogenase [Methylopila capsulata]
MDIRLDGQIAIVTGASSGIGRAVARGFALSGAKVAVNYRSGADEAQALAREIAEAGGEAFAVRADVSDKDQVDAMFAKTVERWGGVDIVVANAGLQKDADSFEMTLDDWRQVIDVNLTGQFLCAQAAIRRFREQGDRGVSRSRGKLVCMSSVHEVIPWAGHVNYAASKGGIALMMKTLAQEVAELGVRVNAIAPGAIRTAINAEELDGENGEQVLKLIPYGRIGDAEDIADVATWLVSDKADYVVGATIFVDGGMTLYPAFRDNG